MKILLLLMCLLIGCGNRALLPDELPRPGFSWSPFPGVVFTESEHPGLYRITVRCNALLDFEDFQISKEVLTPCEAQDFAGKVHYMVTSDQVADLAEYWDSYLK